MTVVTLLIRKMWENSSWTSDRKEILLTRTVNCSVDNEDSFRKQKIQLNEAGLPILKLN